MRTADAFKAITAGEFSRLTTQPDQSGDQLIAVRSNGGSIAVKEMSKGTRFQLYLALRLAGYRRLCDMKDALPFNRNPIAMSKRIQNLNLTSFSTVFFQNKRNFRVFFVVFQHKEAMRN